MIEYLDWIDRHTRRRPAEKRPERAPQEYDVAPSEPIPIAVKEHPTASTTIIRALRRYWTDKRS